MNTTDNLKILKEEPMIIPKKLKEKYNSKEVLKHIEDSRKTISDIIWLNDDRLLVIAWPCSIHNTKEWLEYAQKLVQLKEKFPNLYLVMRTYFEKPRTTIWWEWLISDPNLNWSFNINLWLEKARNFLLKVNKLWLATATEFLEPITTQYIADLVSWWAIWARTTESQTHRHMASGLSMPIWFKNATSWDINIARDAIISSNNSHSFLWINNDWNIRIIKSKWNPDSHLILRWGKSGPNYSADNIKQANEVLKNAWINTWIIIDASHANSNKDHTKQKLVCEDISKQLESWNKIIVWVMLESNLKEGNQKFNPLTDNKQNLDCWVSITDACINIDQTEEILEILDKATQKRNS